LASDDSKNARLNPDDARKGHGGEDASFELGVTVASDMSQALAN